MCFGSKDKSVNDSDAAPVSNKILESEPQMRESTTAAQSFSIKPIQEKPKALAELVAEQKANRKWYHYRPGDNGGCDAIGDW